MREKYFCPNCRAMITCGERYCGYCGTALRWVIPQTITDTTEPPRNTSGTTLSKSTATAIMTSFSADVARLLAEYEKMLKEQHSARPDNQTLN